MAETLAISQSSEKCGPGLHSSLVLACPNKSDHRHFLGGGFPLSISFLLFETVALGV